MDTRIDIKERERSILQLLAKGLSDREIAQRLNLAPETVRWYNKQLYGKLGVTSRASAVTRATALGLIGTTESTTAQRPIERSPIRYLTNEGVSIAYQVVGQGPVDLLFIGGFISHLEMSWEDPGYTTFVEELARSARVILFDRRGVGLSDRVQGASSIENTVSDARAVLSAVGSQRAFVAGPSEGGAAAVLLASMFPEQVQGLVLIAATAKPARRGTEPVWSRPWEQFEKNIELIQQHWGEPWSVERFAPSRKDDPNFLAWWSRAFRAASSPSSARLILEQAMQVDIRPLLPQVRTRTLVVHRRDDGIVPVDAGRYLAAVMPNASMVELPGADHLFFVDPAPITRAIVHFLAEPNEEPQVDTWIAIVLHAAGLGSTLDDDKRRLLESHAARNVRSTPMGWTALFDAPNRALRCAERLRALGRGRVGGLALHVGACRVSDGTPVGETHEVAYRLVEAARPGEVLVSSTLRDILAGSQVELQLRSIDGGDPAIPPNSVWSLVAQGSVT